MKDLSNDPIAWVRLAAAKKEDTVWQFVNVTTDGAMVATNRHRLHVAFNVDHGLSPGVYSASTMSRAEGKWKYPDTSAWWVEVGGGKVPSPYFRSMVDAAAAGAKSMKDQWDPVFAVCLFGMLYSAQYVAEALSGFDGMFDCGVSPNGKRPAVFRSPGRIAVVSSSGKDEGGRRTFDLTSFVGFAQ